MADHDELVSKGERIAAVFGGVVDWVSPVDGVVSVRLPNAQGYVSIDMKRRVWCWGSTMRPWSERNRSQPFTGRGWPEAMGADILAAARRDGILPKGGEHG